MQKISHQLVINLTRFGDLLQTQPVISCLKNGGSSTGLVCLSNFAQAAGLLRGLDLIFPLPGSDLLRDLDQNWIRALRSLHTWKSNLLGYGQWDSVLNLTSTLSCKLLTSSLDLKDKQGFFVDKHGFARFSSKWAIYLEASAGLRGSSPFNLVDVFLRVSGCDPEEAKFELLPAEKETKKHSRSLLDQEKPLQCKGYIGFQLGASEDKRRWPVGYFAELGELVWQNHRLCPVLLGSGAEKGLAKKYREKTSAPAVNLVGRTDMRELAGVLGHLELLVTNDTGTMHLAAGLNKPVLAFFLATAQPWDTAVYKEGNMCLEPNIDCHPCPFRSSCPRDYACREFISPPFVGEMIRGFLGSGTWPQCSDNTCRAWVTVKKHGFMDLQSRNSQGEDDRSRWMRLQKRAYAYFLEGMYPDISDLSLPSGVFMDRVQKEAESIRPFFGLLSVQGNTLLQTPYPSVQKKFMNTWHQVGAMLEQSEIFAPLAMLWKVHSQESAPDIQTFLRVCASYENFLAFFGTDFG